jgi:hypothetical protein
VNSESICATLPSKSMENRRPPLLRRSAARRKPNESGRRVAGVCMKKKYRLVCAPGLTTTFVTTSGFAALSKTDLI